MNFLFVGIGGFIGACLRYAVNQGFARLDHPFPAATLAVNAAAGLLIGFLLGLELHTGAISPRAKLFWATGFLGGLSTFSAFSLETLKLFDSARYGLGVLNILLNTALSLLGVALGLAAARLLFARN